MGPIDLNLLTVINLKTLLSSTLIKYIKATVLSSQPAPIVPLRSRLGKRLVEFYRNFQCASSLEINYSNCFI